MSLQSFTWFPADFAVAKGRGLGVQGSLRKLQLGGYYNCQCIFCQVQIRLLYSASSPYLTSCQIPQLPAWWCSPTNVARAVFCGGASASGVLLRIIEHLFPCLHQPDGSKWTCASYIAVASPGGPGSGDWGLEGGWAICHCCQYCPLPGMSLPLPHPITALFLLLPPPPNSNLPSTYPLCWVAKWNVLFCDSCKAYWNAHSGGKRTKYCRTGPSILL